MIDWKTIGNLLSQWYHVKWWWKFGLETLKKVFLSVCNVIFWYFLHTNFLLYILWVFQKDEIALAEEAPVISAFWKTHLCKLVPNWTRNRMITNTKASKLED